MGKKPVLAWMGTCCFGLALAGGGCETTSNSAKAPYHPQPTIAGNTSATTTANTTVAGKNSPATTGLGLTPASTTGVNTPTTPGTGLVPGSTTGVNTPSVGTGNATTGSASVTATAAYTNTGSSVVTPGIQPVDARIDPSVRGTVQPAVLSQQQPVTPSTYTGPQTAAPLPPAAPNMTSGLDSHRIRTPDDNMPPGNFSSDPNRGSFGNDPNRLTSGTNSSLSVPPPAPSSLSLPSDTPVLPLAPAQPPVPPASGSGFSR